jgi:hypothetical protein
VTVIAVGGTVVALVDGILTGISVAELCTRIGGRSGADLRGGRRGGAGIVDDTIGLLLRISTGESTTTPSLTGEGRRGGRAGLIASDIFQCWC